MRVEAQSWWTPDSGEQEHIHVGGNLPYYQELTGVVDIPITMKLHHAGGEMTGLEVSPFPKPTRDFVHFLGDATSNLIERTDVIECDTASTGFDGPDVLSFQARFKMADGQVRLARIKGGVSFKNGNPSSNNGFTPLVGQAWFSPSDADNRGYSNVTLPYNSIPFTPKKGIWTFKFSVGSSKSGQLRHGLVTVDPDIHAGIPGTIVFEQKNLDKDTNLVSIDTTKFSNGEHKLMLRCSDEGMFPGGTLEGVLVLPFTVNN